MGIVHDEPLDVNDLDMQNLLKTIEDTEVAAIDVEQRLDRLLSNLDELLDGLGSTDRELEQDKESQTRAH